MEKHIRVLVAIRPRLMRELILNTFADQPDIDIVGEVAEEAKVAEAVSRLSPDFLLLSQEDMGKRPSICDLILHQHPGLRIIALAPDRNYSVHYWVSFDIHSHDIEASEEGILGVLRKKSDSLGRLTW
jgi:AmiR/NasT family two-component response regulator